jgi:hypothetical protein
MRRCVVWKENGVFLEAGSDVGMEVSKGKTFLSNTTSWEMYTRPTKVHKFLF